MPSILMLRLLGVAIIALALYGLYWSIDNGGYERGIEEMTGKYREAEIKRDKEQAERIKTAQEKHDADQKTIARLAADARRVRVNFPDCSAITSSEGADGGSRIFQQRIDSAFGKFQQGLEELVLRCDQLNIDSIRANNERPN